MTKKIVTTLGVVFVLIGVLGFIPGVTSDGQLLGIFDVSTAHNIVHLLSGVVALAAVMNGPDATRLFAKVFGVVYGLVTILGFIQGSGAKVLWIINVNQPDNILHLVIAAVLLYVGFSVAPQTRKA